MTYDSSERQYHTRLGWWVMTHPRALSALIVPFSLAVFVAVIVYAADHWHEQSDSFAKGMLLGLTTAVCGGLVVRLPSARTNPRLTNSVLVPMLLVALLGGRWVGGRATVGVLAGVIAALALLFAVMSIWWLLRPTRPRGITGPS